MFHKSRLGAVCTTVVVLVFGLSGCQADDGANPEVPSSSSTSVTASPSVTPTPANPAEAAVAERAADAEQRYREYLRISSEHGKKSRSPFEELLNNGYLGNADTREYEKSYWEQFTDLGLKETGDAHLELLDVTAYKGDPLEEDITGHRVNLEMCLDNSQWDVVRPDGSSAIEPERPVKFVIDVVMQGQPSGLWSLTQNKYTKKEC